MKQENPRTDIVTRKPFPKEELLRFTIVDGVIVISESSGRGYYLHKKTDLEAKATRKALNRVLRHEVSDLDLATLKEAL